MQELASAGWRVLSASVPGSSHLVRGIECQDTHEVRILDNGSLILAVCDGAGSARRAAEGAALTARATVEFLACSSPPTDRDDWRRLSCECLLHVRSALLTRTRELAVVEQIAQEEA